MFTYQTLIDRVLAADGITKEMVEAQQKRINLIQRLLSVPNAEDRITIIHQEAGIVDGNMFAILSTLLQSASMQGDEASGKLLGQIQSELLKETEVGQQLLADSQETQSALKELDEANKSGLTREKLLDILMKVKSESSLATLVSLTRSGMDYQFFQVLSERIEKADGESKQQMVVLRDRLLSLTREIDLEMKKRLENANKLLDTILKDENLDESLEKHIAEIDDFFSQAVQSAFEKARDENDLARIEKIQKVISTLEKYSAAPPEIEFLQTLLEAPDEASRAQLLGKNADKVNDEFLNTINSIIAEGEARKQSPELLEALRGIYKAALRLSMEKNLKG
jgi:hemerythrin-like domain-containing protein